MYIAFASTGLSESIALPSTLRMRPSVASPTGTVIGAPVSRTSAPRTMPSVPPIASVRTWLLPSSLLHFERQLVLFAVAAFEVREQRRIDVGQGIGAELDVDDVAEHLDDFTGTRHGVFPLRAVGDSLPFLRAMSPYYNKLS